MQSTLYYLLESTLYGSTSTQPHARNVVPILPSDNLLTKMVLCSRISDPVSKLPWGSIASSGKIMLLFDSVE